MTVENMFAIHVDEATPGTLYASMGGRKRTWVQVTISGSTATAAVAPVKPTGELKPVDIDESGHIFVKRAGRWVSIGTAHERGHVSYPLAVNKAGALLKDVKGQWVSATYAA